MLSSHSVINKQLDHHAAAGGPGTAHSFVNATSRVGFAAAAEATSWTSNCEPLNDGRKTGFSGQLAFVSNKKMIVRGSVAPAQGSLLLGQSYLERFNTWSIDNVKHVLILEPK
jgi:hypothetical protein